MELFEMIFGVGLITWFVELGIVMIRRPASGDQPPESVEAIDVGTGGHRMLGPIR